MANKWNTTDIEKISTAFTQKTIEKCFQDDLKMSGDEIVTLTPFPQINYFVLREIFSRWEADTERFKSPYFDFDSEDVKKSFTDFKNTLSRHIAVDRENFKILLESATKKTLELLMKPESFFIADFRNLPDFRLTAEWLRKNTVFFKAYYPVIEGLNTLLNTSDQWIYANQGLEEVKRLLADNLEDHSETINAIAEEAGLVAEEPPVVKPTSPREENDNLSFFERLVANPPRPTTEFREPEISAFDRIVNSFPKVKEQEPVTPAVITVTESVVSPPAPKENPVIEVPTTIIDIPNVQIEVPKPVAEPVKPLQAESRSMFEGLNIPTLNDRHSSQEGNSLSDLHQRSKIESLKGSMTLNQRFSFLNSLFKTDLNAFEGALQEVEKSPSFETAKELLNNRYASQFNWNQQSDDYKEFLGLIKRRFN